MAFGILNNIPALAAENALNGTQLALNRLSGGVALTVSATLADAVCPLPSPIA